MVSGTAARYVLAVSTVFSGLVTFEPHSVEQADEPLRFRFKLFLGEFNNRDVVAGQTPGPEPMTQHQSQGAFNIDS